MTKTVEYYLGLPYSVELHQEKDEGWFAHVREWPGCMTQADTAEDALANLKEVIPFWLEGALQSGYEIPEPRRSDYSGRFMVRVPKSLHRTVAELAERDGVSINQLVNLALALLVGREGPSIIGTQPALSGALPSKPGRLNPGRTGTQSMRVVREDAPAYQTTPVGKYAPLYHHLAAVSPSQNRQSLTFAMVEEIIGDALPRSARSHREWWSNDHARHVQAHAWLDAAWRVETVDWSTETVHFVRS